MLVLPKIQLFNNTFAKMDFASFLPDAELVEAYDFNELDIPFDKLRGRFLKLAKVLK